MQGASETIPRTLSVNFVFSAPKGKESDLQPMKGTTLTDISDSGIKLYLHVQCWALFLCIVTVIVSWEIILRFSLFRPFSLAPFKINWVAESRKFLFAESQILRFGIWDSAQGIQIPEFTLRWWGIRNPWLSSIAIRGSIGSIQVLKNCPPTPPLSQLFVLSKK